MAPASDVAPTPRPRRALRVTTGCRTCRRRHVKCDERRPKCANCGKKNRDCEYDPPPDESAANTSLQGPDDVETLPDAPPSAENGPPPHTDSLPSVVSNSDSQPLDGLQYSVTQPSVESPESPFLATLGSILLNTEFWTVGERIPESQTRQTPNYPDHLSDLEFHWPVLHVDQPIHLSPSEIAIFRNYVENVSRWIDSFSHDLPFRRLVSIWALRCPLLLHSCLALSSKQMILAGTHIPAGFDESVALRYYRLALKTVRELLLNPQYVQSDEVLAACIILSTYEMIDVAGENLGSHLQGVASLLQSRLVQGDVDGVRGAAYWTWYRHEIWAALQTGRRISLDESYWEPPAVSSFQFLQIEDIANRVIFILGQCINFSNGYGISEGTEVEEVLHAKHARAAQLNMALEEWQAKIPDSMASFFSGQPKVDEVGDGAHSFPAKWFVFPQSAIAHQVYHASKIILALHQPSPIQPPRGLNKCASLSIRRQIEISREQIFLTANAIIPDAWSLVSAQCLYIAGLVTEGSHERRRTLELIDECQRRTGRQTGFITNELRALWSF